MGSVFSFTFRQNTKGKGFIFATFIIPIILCLAGVVISVIMANDSSKEEYVSPINKVYIENKTDLQYMDFSNFALNAGNEYSKTEFVTGESVPESEKHSLQAVIEEKDDQCSVTVNVPEWSELSRDDAGDIIPGLTSYIEQLRKIDAVIKSSDGEVNESDIMLALTPVNVNNITEGDEATGIGAMLFEMLAPLLLVFVLYMMAIIYGQTISKIVISEKVSKLMETLLITVKPYQLIAGKILAMASIAIMQMLLWITGVVAGIFIGDAVARGMNPDFTNYILEALKLVKETDGGLAFSLPALILSVVVLIISFIFFCVCAGLVSSPVSKAEELSSIFGIYQIIIVIAFLASYMLPLTGNMSPLLSKVLHVVPFTAAFMLPGDILIGKIAIGESIIYVVILCVFTVLFALYTGKIYKDQVFYNNSSVNVFKRLFASNASNSAKK